MRPATLAVRFRDWGVDVVRADVSWAFTRDNRRLATGSVRRPIASAAPERRDGEVALPVPTPVGTTGRYWHSVQVEDARAAS